MPIAADGALTNTIIVGKNQRKPIYKFTNAQLAMGSIKGTFNSNIISNELPIDTFSFNVNYDDEGNQVYLTSDTNQAYVCAGYVPGTFESCGWVDNPVGNPEISENTISLATRSDVFYIRIPSSVRESQKYLANDVLRIAVNITENGERLEFSDTQSRSFTVESETGLFTFVNGNVYTYAYATNTGFDVLTFTFTGNNEYGIIAVSARSGAKFEINGMSFNGEMVYGSFAQDLDESYGLPALYILSNKDKTPASEYLRDIKYGTPVWWYCNHKFMAKGYYKGNTRTSRTTWKIDAMSAIGKLDEKIHVGGIYTGQTFKSVLTEICGNTCRFEFDEGDEALENLQVFGWLPYDTARNNLHRLLFAMGASIKKVNVT